MGKWSVSFFDRDTLPSVCFLFAGSSKHSFIDGILSNFDTVVFHEYSHFERVIAKHNGIEYLLLFQVYGAASMIDLMAVLNDGNVKKITFFGSAFGIEKSLDVGDFIIPNKVQALEGVLNFLHDTEYVFPDSEQSNLIKRKLRERNIKYLEGKTVSVPCVTAQPKYEVFDKDLIGLEMECSSFFFYAQKYNIVASALLVVSDTFEKKLSDSKGDHKTILSDAFKCFI